MLNTIIFLFSISIIQGQLFDIFTTVSDPPQKHQHISVLGDSTSIQDSLNLVDPWFGFDKVQHFTFSFLWMLSTQYILVNKFQAEEESAFPISLTSGAIIGLLKEVHDARKPDNRFSKRDLVADGLGLLFATVIITSNPDK